MPGKVRWVTTTIARFDPDVDWPTDLDCSFKWNKGLTSYDGEGSGKPQRLNPDQRLKWGRGSSETKTMRAGEPYADTVYKYKYRTTAYFLQAH